MKIRILLATAIAIFLTLIAGIIGKFIFHPETDFLLFILANFITLFLVVYSVLHYFLHSKLKQIYQKVVLLKKSENSEPEKPLVYPDNMLTTIYDSLLELSLSSKKEIQQLQELETFRKEFIINVTHELKTPVFAIQGYLETLLDGAMDNKNVNKKFMKQALKNVERLNTLVNDLFTLSQLETGEMRMNKEEFKIYDLILNVIDLLEHKFNKDSKTVTYTVGTGETDRVLVMADKERIQQVLTNLIDNAIKYGPNDVRIAIKLQRINGKLKIQIQDNGPGIEPQHLPYIFDRFYRVDPSRSRQIGGTGLGLSIVKKIIEAHQEKIEVESFSGKGTAFSFTLPVAR